MICYKPERKNLKAAAVFWQKDFKNFTCRRESKGEQHVSGNTALRACWPEDTRVQTKCATLRWDRKWFLRQGKWKLASKLLEGLVL